MATALGCSPELDGENLLLEANIKCFGCRTWINQAGTELEVSFLLASFHKARRCYAGCWRRNVINNPTQLWTLPALLPMCPSRCAHWCNDGIIWGNQLLSDWTSSLLHRREFNLVLVKLVKSLWLRVIGPSGEATAVVLLKG